MVAMDISPMVTMYRTLVAKGTVIWPEITDTRGVRRITTITLHNNSFGQ